MRVLPEQIVEWEKLVRAGRADLARPGLVKNARSRLPRFAKATVARLLRRAGVPALGLRLLARHVRPTSRSPAPASPDEKAEYAACLSRLGASEEALELLETLDDRENPEVLLYRVIALAAQWRYPETVAPLQRYLNSPGLGNYRRAVGKVNLAAAFVFQRDWVKADSLCRELLHETSLRKLPLLHANTLELSAEHLILQKRWSEAERCLDKARGLIGASGTVFELMVLRWERVLAYMKGETPGLDDLRALARKRNHWETLRDCDRFEALRTADEALAVHLHFGTPYGSYRKRLVDEFPSTLVLPPECRWRPDARVALGGAGAAAHFDLLSGEARSAQGKALGSLRVGQLPHRLLIALAGDFYRPFRTHTLFARLHPEEFFNPLTSPGRIHETVRTLRLWLAETGVPLDVESTEEAYRLRGTGPVTLTLTSDPKLGQARGAELEALRRSWPKAPFAVAAAVDLLGLPRRTVQRVLREAAEAGTLERTGRKGYTRYRFE